MGRSVSTHRHAVETVFIVHDISDQESWSDFVDDIRSVLTGRFPSLSKADRWAGREDRVILDSGVAEVSVSDYCGLAAVCLAPLRPDNALNVGWCEQVASSFDRILTAAFKEQCVQRDGFMSNGEAVYRAS